MQKAQRGDTMYHVTIHLTTHEIIEYPEIVADSESWAIRTAVMYVLNMGCFTRDMIVSITAKEV